MSWKQLQNISTVGLLKTVQPLPTISEPEQSEPIHDPYFGNQTNPGATTIAEYSQGTVMKLPSAENKDKKMAARLLQISVRVLYLMSLWTASDGWE